jgi:hypothetical protein
MDMHGRRVLKEHVIDVFDPPRAIGHRNESGAFWGNFRYDVEPEGTGARVTFTAHAFARGLNVLVLPFLIRGNRRTYADQLESLRAAMDRVRTPTG